MNLLSSLHLKNRYNHWMNRKLYASCAQLTDAQRKQDMGAFFRSVHGTLNHLLLTDRLWLSRLTGTAFSATGLDQILYEDFAELDHAREQTDAELAALIHSLSEADLSGIIRYHSLQSGRYTELSRGLILTHLFNHQTHHRGQISTLLMQLGQDIGVTDMIFMPEANALISS